jgi:hypothetical protein
MSNTSRANSTFARSIDSIGWALFFMWVGIAMLANFSWTVSLIGTAVIVLGVQGALFFRRERLDIFMLAIGVVLLFGTITDMYGLPLSLIPALLIVIGIMMFADALRAHPGRQTDR